MAEKVTGKIDMGHWVDLAFFLSLSIYMQIFLCLIRNMNINADRMTHTLMCTQTHNSISVVLQGRDCFR